MSDEESLGAPGLDVERDRATTSRARSDESGAAPRERDVKADRDATERIYEESRPDRRPVSPGVPEREADKTIELEGGAFEAYLKLYDKDPDADLDVRDEPPPNGEAQTEK